MDSSAQPQPESISTPTSETVSAAPVVAEPKTIARSRPPGDRELGGDATYVDVPLPEGANANEYVPDEYIGNPIAPNAFCRGWNGKPSRLHYCHMVAGWGTDHVGIGRCKHHGGNHVMTTGARIRYEGIGHRRIGDLIKKFAQDPDPLNMLAELDMARAILVDFVERHAEFIEQLADWHASFRVAKQPISEEDAMAYERSIIEYSIILDATGTATEKQLSDLVRAQRFLAAMRKPVDEGRPRKVTDLMDAVKAIEAIGKTIDRLDKRDTISEPELNRILGAMSRTVDVIVTDPEQKKLIREGWMRAVTR